MYIQCKLYSTCHYCVVCIYSASYTVHTSFILFLQEHPPANHSTYTHTHVLHYCWHKEISRKDPKWPTAIAFCTPQCALHHACLCACHLILKPLMHLHTTPLWASMGVAPETVQFNWSCCDRSGSVSWACTALHLLATWWGGYVVWPLAWLSNRKLGSDAMIFCTRESSVNNDLYVHFCVVKHFLWVRSRCFTWQYNILLIAL